MPSILPHATSPSPSHDIATSSFATLLGAQMNSGESSVELARERQVQAASEMLDPAELQKIEETSQQFESILLYSLLKQMWDTLPDDSMLEKGLAAKFYREMWLEELAGQISTTGDGLGVGKVVKHDMIMTAARSIDPEDMQHASTS